MLRVHSVKRRNVLITRRMRACHIGLKRPNAVIKESEQPVDNVNRWCDAATGQVGLFVQKLAAILGQAAQAEIAGNASHGV